MSSERPFQKSFRSLPLSENTWPDFLKLFGEKGACGGCWCMTPRSSIKEYNLNKGEKNKQLLQGLMQQGEPLGVIAYHENEPVAWCSISPKERLMEMRKSRIMNLTPAENTWSIVCLFIRKDYRRKGMATHIINSAKEYAATEGAKFVEAYPLTNRSTHVPDVFAWNGILKSYERAGFEVAMKISDGKCIARYKV